MVRSSILELRIENILIHHGYKNFIKEYRFHPVRKFRFDFAFIEKKIAIEAQGAIWTHGKHSRGGGLMADMEKNNLAVTMGWRVLFYSSQTIYSIPVDLIAIGA